MTDGLTLGAFVAAALAVLLTPGPAVAYVVARSVEMGRRAGLVSQLGLCTGLLVHVAASVLGLSVVLARSAYAFQTLKWCGAAYLVWLGIRALTSEDGAVAAPTRESKGGLGRLFVDGFVIDALNPKPALFFLAFLPQFVGAGTTDPRPQLALLGLLFVLMAFLTGTVWAVLGASVSRRLRRSPSRWRAVQRLSGSIYLGLGVLAALWSTDR